MKKKRFVIIDGHALLHRAFHALPPLTTSKGEPVRAIYGFFLIFLNAFKELRPDYIAVCLDRAEPTFRHIKFKEYKAHRPQTPEELKEQIPLLKEGLEVFGIPILEKKGFEADDIIATLVSKITARFPQIEIIILTGDLDTLQLIKENVKVLGLKRGLTDISIYDERTVRERFGFEPLYLVDYKALRGDPSDNIPGIKGIGEKTAQELIKKYKTIENLFKALKENRIKQKPKILEALKKGEKIAYLSKDLARARSNLKINFLLDDFVFRDFSYNKVVEWFKKMEFNSLLNRIPKFNREPALFDKIEEEKGKKREWDLEILNEKNFDTFFKNLKKTKCLVFDTETTHLKGKLIGISFCFSKDKAYFLPLSDFYDFKFKSKKIFSKLKQIFENKTILKIGHNLKYDFQVLKKEGLDVAPPFFDTMIASWLLDPETRNHNLERLAFLELGYQKIPKDSLFGSKDNFDLRRLRLSKIAEYSAEDSWVTYCLYYKLLDRLKEMRIYNLFKEIEMPLVKVLARIEERGIKVEKRILENLKNKVEKKIENLKAKIFKIAKRRFNLNSPIQLREILFEHLNIDKAKIKRTKTGLSTAASELEKMKGKHKIIDLILRYRELSKLMNTYLEALPLLIEEDGRVHTTFNQTSTSTGRLSTSEPNLQNIPARTKIGREIRKAFVAPSGKKLIVADYSQIELRVIAHLSSDPKMIEAFKKGEDIHTATASLIYNVPLKKVTPKMRRLAKTVNFGVIYGMSSYGLAQTLKISQKQALDFIQKYFSLFKKIKLFQQSLLKKAKEQQFVETLFGRKRFLKNIVSPVSDLQSQAERAAINMPVQGTAADIIKKAMIKLEEGAEKKLASLKMILQVHDELIFEIDKKDAKKGAHFVKNIMENIVKLKVPLKVDINIVNSWGDIKK